MIRIGLLMLFLLTFMICSLSCIESYALTIAPDSTTIMSPISSSELAGYYDGWKKKDIAIGKVFVTLVIGAYVPFIGDTVLYNSIKGEKPTTVPTDLDSLMYIKGFQEASKTKNQVSVDIPRRIMNYGWSGVTVIIVALYISFQRHPLFGD